MKNMLSIDYKWVSFNQEWGKHYKNAKHILAYLNTYPNILTTLRLGEIHNSVTLDYAQNEWIWLCAQFENPIDKEFFKAYWIPIQVNSYDYFLDISDENYPIFEIYFFFFEPFRWYKKFVSTDTKEILLAPDTGLNLKNILDKNDKIRWDQVGEYFKERKRLGYEGKINVKPVERDELILDDSDSKLGKLEFKNARINVSKVTSVIAGLLPFDLRINLKYIYYQYGNPNESIDKVRIIRDLVFLLRESGLRRVGSYRIDFPDSKNCYFEYKNESCILYHSEKKISNDFVRVFDELMKKSKL